MAAKKKAKKKVAKKAKKKVAKKAKKKVTKKKATKKKKKKQTVLFEVALQKGPPIGRPFLYARCMPAADFYITSTH